jgi:uncharacterized protein (DUF2147 family)
MLSLSMIASLLFSFNAQSQDVKSKVNASKHPLTGLWVEAKKHKIAVWVEECQGQLCGRIYWLKKPLTKNGTPKLDDKNPKVALRTRHQCGLQILSGFSPSKKANVWHNGEIYNPKSGKTYHSEIYLAKNETLKIRGYIGIPLFGKTLEWQRPRQKLIPCDKNIFTDKL